MEMDYSETLPFDGDAEAWTVWNVPAPPRTVRMEDNVERQIPETQTYTEDGEEEPAVPTIAYETQPFEKDEPAAPTIAYETQLQEDECSADVGVSELEVNSAVEPTPECGHAAVAATLAYAEDDRGQASAIPDTQCYGDGENMRPADDRGQAFAIPETQCYGDGDDMPMLAFTEVDVEVAAMAAEAAKRDDAAKRDSATMAAECKAAEEAQAERNTAEARVAGASANAVATAPAVRERRADAAHAENVRVTVEREGPRAVGAASAMPPPRVPASSPRRLQQSASPEHANNTCVLQQGARVRLRGLQGMPELNGTEGVCGLWSEERDRWHVKLNMGEEWALKPCNLELISDDTVSPRNALVSPSLTPTTSARFSTASECAVRPDAASVPNVVVASTTAAPLPAQSSAPAASTPTRRRLRGKQPRPEGLHEPIIPTRRSAGAAMRARRNTASGADDVDDAVPIHRRKARPAPETRTPAEALGAKVQVQGDGWGGGEGSYTATVTEVGADDCTYTVVFQALDSGRFEETHVLREHCTIIHEGQGQARRRRS